MVNISFHFYRGNSIISRLIQLRTFSQFSHCSIQVGDIIYEAKERIGVRKIFARKTPPKSLVDTISYGISGKQSYELIEWLEKQLGKKYDYKGVLLFLGRPKKDKKNKCWYCSELASEVVYKLKIKKDEKISLSPGALYLLLK